MSSGGGGGGAAGGASGSDSNANLFYGDESSSSSTAAAAVAPTTTTTTTPPDTTNSAPISRQSSTTQQQTTSNRTSNTTNTIGMWRDPNAPNVPTTNGFEPNDDFDSDQLDEDEESYSWASTDNQDLIPGGHSRHLNNRRHGSNSPNLGGGTGAGQNGLSFGSTQLPNWRDWKQPAPANQPGLILPNTTNVSSTGNRSSSAQLNDYLMNMLTRNSNGPLGFPPGVTAATTTNTTTSSPGIFQTIPQMNVSFF